MFHLKSHATKRLLIQTMGNSLACFSPTTPATKTNTTSSKASFPPWLSPSYSHKKSRKSQSYRSPFKVVIDDSYIKKQAHIATMLYNQHLQNKGGNDFLLRLECSVSTNNPPSSYKKSKKNSMRSRSLSCSTSVSALQLTDQDVSRSEDHEPESKHFVLVRGGGFGAWCWYKIIALLQESKHKVDAIDLSGSGTNSCDTNSIKTLADYATSLTHLIANLSPNKEVYI